MFKGDVLVRWAGMFILLFLAGCGGKDKACADAGLPDGSDQAVPAVPKGLSAAALDGKVELGWEASAEDDLAGYNLYWGTGANPYSQTVFVAASVHSFVVEGLVNGTSYQFMIDAQDQNGLRSQKSTAIAVVPVAPNLPFRPKAFIPLPGDGQVKVLWTSGGRAALKGHNVYWGLSGGSLDNAQFVPIVDQQALITGLQNGIVYYFAMDSEDELGNRSLRTEAIAVLVEPPDTIPPSIVATDPMDGAVNVAVDTLVGITFLESMDPDTLELQVNPQASVRKVYWNEGFTEIVFGFVLPLARGQAFQISVEGKDLAGNALSGTTSFSFTTDATAAVPQALGSSPAYGAAEVPSNSRLTLAFSEPMNKASVQRNWTSIPDFDCAFTWEAGDRLVSCLPSTATGAGLAENTTYTVAIGAQAQSAVGQPLGADRLLVFRTAFGTDTTAPTVISTLPANDAGGQDNRAPIVITFSEPMDRAWTQAAFTVVCQYGMDGIFSWNDRGDVMTYEPGFSYLDGEEVNWTLLGQAKDLAGNALGTDLVGGFRAAQHAMAMVRPMAAQDGSVSEQGEVVSDLPIMVVGRSADIDGENIYLYRGFMGFDLSVLPENVEITYATLRVYFFRRSYFNPVTELGPLVAQGTDYGSGLEASDFNAATGHLYTCDENGCSWVPMDYPISVASGQSGYQTTAVTPAVRYAYENRADYGYRSQFRLKFEHDIVAGDSALFMSFTTGDCPAGCWLPYLTVSYSY